MTPNNIARSHPRVDSGKRRQSGWSERVTDGSQRSGAGRVVREALERANVSRPARSNHVQRGRDGDTAWRSDRSQCAGECLWKRANGSEAIADRKCQNEYRTSGGAAGLAGLIKIILSLESHEIPLQRNLSHPNRLIDWANVPLTVVTQAVRWERGAEKKRMAAVRAFCVSRIECARDRGGSSGAK